MRTVSPELARKLKETGLEWEWKIGDWYCVYDVVTGNIVPACMVAGTLVDENFSLGNYLPEHFERVWLPTLSDLLEWLEGRGYAVDLIQIRFSGAKYRCDLWKKTEKDWAYIGETKADTREDVVAKAVLWVLEQETVRMGQR